MDQQVGIGYITNSSGQTAPYYTGGQHSSGVWDFQTRRRVGIRLPAPRSLGMGSLYVSTGNWKRGTIPG